MGIRSSCPTRPVKLADRENRPLVADRREPPAGKHVSRGGDAADARLLDRRMVGGMVIATPLFEYAPPCVVGLSVGEREGIRLKKRLIVLMVGALSIALMAAGCGSSSKSASTPTITKAEFLAKGNAICTRGSAQLAAVTAKLGPKSTAAQVATTVRGPFAFHVQAQIDRIRALGAPAADQATVTHMLNVAQADLNRVKSNPALLTSNTDAFANFSKLAHQYGLTACARNS